MVRAPAAGVATTNKSNTVNGTNNCRMANAFFIIQHAPRARWNEPCSVKRHVGKADKQNCRRAARDEWLISARTCRLGSLSREWRFGAN